MYYLHRTFHSPVDKYLNEFVDTLKILDYSFFNTLADDIFQAKKDSQQLFVIGDGGSAASSSHWVCDFSKNITTNDRQKRLHIQSLVDNTPLLTALGNDISYDQVFVEQLKNYMNSDDIVIGLSVSGNSANLIKALEYANSNGGKTYAIIGNFGGLMGRLAAKTLVVPSKNYGIVEDVHMYTCHLVSQFLKQQAQIS